MPTIAEIITNFFVFVIGLYLGTLFPVYKQIIFGIMVGAAIVYTLLKLDERGVRLFNRSG